MQPWPYDMKKMKEELSELWRRKVQPLQDSGLVKEAAASDLPSAATASDLPSAATASDLPSAATASKVESMKVEGHTPPASGIVKAAAASGLPSAATVSSGLASATPAIDVENMPGENLKYDVENIVAIPASEGVSADEADEEPFELGVADTFYTTSGTFLTHDGQRIDPNQGAWKKKTRGVAGSMRSRGKHRPNRRKIHYEQLQLQESKLREEYLIQERDKLFASRAVNQGGAASGSGQRGAAAQNSPPLVQNYPPLVQNSPSAVQNSKSTPAASHSLAAAAANQPQAAAASQPQADAKTDGPRPAANRGSGLPAAARGSGLPNAATARSKMVNETWNSGHHSRQRSYGHRCQRWDDHQHWDEHQRSVGSEAFHNRSQQVAQGRGTQDIRRGNFGPSSDVDEFPDWFPQVCEFVWEYNEAWDFWDRLAVHPESGIILKSLLQMQYKRWLRQKRRS